jgi:hypothetical protein
MRLSAPPLDCCSPTRAHSSLALLPYSVTFVPRTVVPFCLLHSASAGYFSRLCRLVFLASLPTGSSTIYTTISLPFGTSHSLAVAERRVHEYISSTTLRYANRSIF